MIELLSSYWEIIVAILILIFAGFYIPGLRTIWILGLKSLLTKKILTKIILGLIEKKVKKTESKIDDEWFEELKKQINGVK